MEAFAFYLLKSVIWLAGFALVFILFLRNERFFLLNRIYLVAGILSSFFLPLVSVHYTVVLPVVTSVQSGVAVVSEIQNPEGGIMSELKFILWVLYATGILFVLTVIIRQGRSVLRTIKKSEVHPFHPVKLIRTTDYTSAFSFFSYVFVNPSVTDLETNEIMNHELVHIRQKHWIDLVLVELLCMMQWFNPLVWIYVRFIRQNHEYLADEVALQRTSDPAIYRAALLNQIVGAPVVSLANSFNYSLNKKRFTMMKNIISSPYRKMKILLILPVFAIVLYAFAKPDYKYTNARQKEDGMMASDTTKKTNKWVPPPPPPAQVPADLNSKDAPTPPPSINEIQPLPAAPQTPAVIFKTDGPTPLYLVDGLVVTEAEATILNPEAIKSVNVLKDKKAIQKYGKKGKNGVVVITTRKDDKEFENAAFPKQPLPLTVYNLEESGKTPLVIIDGEIKTVDVDKIDPETIESVNVLKDKVATDKYGEKAKDGAIEVKTRKAQKVEIRSENGVTPLVVVDGVIKDIKIEAIDPETIESITVLKDESATAKYGAKGKDGVIELVLKKEIQVENSTGPVKVKNEIPVESSVSVNIKNKEDGGKQPLVIVDGIIKDIDINSIDPATVESVNVPGKYQAARKYGDKAKDGAVEIKLKKPGEKIQDAKE